MYTIYICIHIYIYIYIKLANHRKADIGKYNRVIKADSSDLHTASDRPRTVYYKRYNKLND